MSKKGERSDWGTHTLRYGLAPYSRWFSQDSRPEKRSSVAKPCREPDETSASSNYRIQVDIIDYSGDRVGRLAANLPEDTRW